MRAFERALRRTGLPLRMSEGFHPKPKISFPAALGVGIEGTDEVMEFDLAEWVPPQRIEQAVKEQLPAGLDFTGLELGSPGKAARATEATYHIQPAADLRADERLTQERFDALLARAEIPVCRIRKRKEKTADIRPFLIALRRLGDDILLDVTAGPQGSTRPEEVFGVLGFDRDTIATALRITRTRVTLAS